jgi:hypothetical protein
MNRVALLGILMGCLSSCAIAPVDVRQCSVHPQDNQTIALDLDIRNNDHRAVKQIHVIVRTSGLYSDKAADGSTVEYAVQGAISSGSWVSRLAAKPVYSDYFTRSQRLGTVISCDVHAVDFADGSHWEGPSPL